MANAPGIRSTDDAWDTGELGRDERYVKTVEVDEAALDAALELQLISVRLQRSLIDGLKLIAKANGIGYQPLMRQALHRFVDSELKRLVISQQKFADAKVAARAEAKSAVPAQKRSEGAACTRKAA